jgi:hypothetical protein
MENKRIASAIPACNLIIALLIFAQIPMMFGQADSNAIIYVLPWTLSAFPLILICVILMYVNGEFVDATMNALLSGVLMGQNFVRGVISLTMYNAGTAPTAEMLASSYKIDFWVYLVSGIILVTAGWLAHFNSKMAAAGIWAGGLGFLCLAATYAGLGSVFGLLGAVGLVILAIYLLYSGLALMLNTAMQKEVLPIR